MPSVSVLWHPNFCFCKKNPSSLSCSQWGFYMLCGQTFKHHSSPTSPRLSPLTLGMSASQLWAAFLEKPCQCLLQQLSAFVVKLPTSKMAMGTGALKSKINVDKKRMQTYSCAYRKQKLCCLQVRYGWEEKNQHVNMCLAINKSCALICIFTFSINFLLNFFDFFFDTAVFYISRCLTG